MSARLLAALALSCCCACGETNTQAIERLRSPYQQERSLLARVVASLPPPGTTPEMLPRRLDPAPVLIDGYDPNAPRAPNVEVLSVDQASPDSGAAGFETHLGRSLDPCLAWTGPNNPLSDGARGDRGTLGADCERALAAPYLVLTRLVEERLPERLLFEAFIVQHREERILGTVVIDLRLTPPAPGAARPPLPDEAAVSSEFHEAARCALLGRLARIDGATVRSNARCPAGALTIEVRPPLLQRAAP